jgi:hypothetical protein
MLFFEFNGEGTITNVYSDAEMDRMEHRRVKSRWDIRDFAEAERWAELAQVATGKQHLAVDSGAHCSPRFDVIEAPKVGDPVSEALNGDYYPCGHITRISASYRRIETDGGDVFHRYRDSASWRKQKSSFWMVIGHRNERNPDF